MPVLKRIGLVGGMSPESTKEYYSALVALARKTFGDGSDNPEIVIYSINLSVMTAHMSKGRHKEVVELLSRAFEGLAKAGVEVAALTANTPHIFFDELKARSAVPLVSIIDAAYEHAKVRKFKKVLLTGTRHTMASEMYPKAFARCGITVIVPDDAERQLIDNAIRKELTHGILLPKTRRSFIDIGLRHIKEDGVDCVILGCTEIPLLLKEGDLPVPLLDTTQVHAEAIFKVAWTKEDDRKVKNKK